MIDLLSKSKYPIFVLEGPDGAGKTSLAKNLQEYLGARYIHLTYRFSDKMHLYHGAAFRLCRRLAETQPVVLDRWWPSEIIYSDVYRGGSKFAKYSLLFEFLASRAGVTYVMCLPEDRERYLTHFHELKAEREEMYDDRLDQVYDEYMTMYRHFLSLKDNVCHYDLFKNFQMNENSRDLILKTISQNVLEFAEDHRSSL